MFTIRFDLHDGGYKVRSCDHYSVSLKTDDCKNVSGYDAEGPASWIETIGDNEPFHRAYVTNQSGRTVDTVYSPENITPS